MRTWKVRSIQNFRLLSLGHRALTHTHSPKGPVTTPPPTLPLPGSDVGGKAYDDAVAPTAARDLNPRRRSESQAACDAFPLLRLQIAPLYDPKRLRILDR